MGACHGPTWRGVDMEATSGYAPMKLAFVLVLQEIYQVIRASEHIFLLLD